MVVAAILSLELGHILVTDKCFCVTFGVQTDVGHTTITVAQFIPLLIKCSRHRGFIFLHHLSDQ